MRDQREFDVIAYGASSFVGQILARYLAAHPAHQSLRWAIAGRSEAKLQGLRSTLSESARDVPILLADASDAESLRALAARTRVLISTVGPYAIHGEPVLAACVETGTDYCDLTGETQWIARMLQGYEARAQQTGARIVHCCGFDSIPSDMGVWFLQNEARSRFGHPLPRVKMRVRAAKGGFSGGTVASLLNVIEEAQRDPTLRKQLGDPYLIAPPLADRPKRQPDVRGAVFDQDFKAWTAPFVMAAINTRVVQRSHALGKGVYGADFRYDEGVLTGRGLKGRLAATGTALGLGGFMLASAFKPTRRLLQRFALPAPGEGPSLQQQTQGFFDLRFIGKDDAGHQLRVKVTGDRDPGYGFTGRMLGEAAACLALDVPETATGGFWTPSTLLGDALLKRLRDHAQMGFEVLS
jgi:short subunit dehydrogenase-like uncharacterized protein